ncbi:MAG TPA: hypothetical protein VK101_05860 [Limnochordia bacterium]|nr:hypothetical protein [Limnochordia bacterium]
MGVEAVLERSLVELEAKFMRLLELDRDSAEFEKLYDEVDKELAALASDDAAEIQAS